MDRQGSIDLDEFDMGVVRQTVQELLLQHKIVPTVKTLKVRLISFSPENTKRVYSSGETLTLTSFEIFHILRFKWVADRDMVLVSDR